MSDFDRAVLDSLMSIWWWCMAHVWLPIAAVVHAMMLWLIFRERRKAKP